jgi:hypothetical protein
MDQALYHPIYRSLLAPAGPVARHALLHDMELQLARLRERCPGLHARVRGFVDRGVPYFAPSDAHYRDWAAKAAHLWDELHQRDCAEVEAAAPAAPFAA